MSIESLDSGPSLPSVICEMEDRAAELRRLRAEIERLRAALKPFADEVDMLGLHGNPPPPERMLMFASDGGGTFLGIQVSTLYDAHRAYQQGTIKP